MMDGPDITSSSLDDMVKSAMKGSYIPGVMREVKEEEGEKQAAVEKLEAANKQTLAADKAAVEKAKPKDMDVRPWKEEAPQTDPIKAFGSFGSVFGILASAFTHQPWYNAMNASAAAIRAVHEGDRQRYEDAYKAWKENTELALERHKEQHEAYADAMEKMREDISEGNAALNQIAAKYGDKITATMTEAGLMEKLGDIHESRQKAALGMEQAKQDIEEGHVKLTALLDLRDAYKSKDPDKIKQATDYWNAVNGKGASAGSAGVLSGDALDYAAEFLRRKGTMPSQGLGSSGAATINRQMIEQRAAELGQMEMRGESMPAAALALDSDIGYQAGIRAGTTALANDEKYQDALERGVRTIDGMFPIAEQYMRRLPLTEIRSINQGIVAGKTEFGSPDANNYANAMNSIALEYGRIMAGPQSAAMLPVEVIKLGMNRLSNLTPEQFAGEKELIHKESDNIRQANAETIRRRKSALAGGGEPGLSPSDSLGPTATLNGRTIVVKGGKWVYQDTGEVVPNE